jgi:hypothetical protein
VFKARFKAGGFCRFPSLLLPVGDDLPRCRDTLHRLAVHGRAKNFCTCALDRSAGKSYGFRTCRVLELALYHSLGKLPEP